MTTSKRIATAVATLAATAALSLAVAGTASADQGLCGTVKDINKDVSKVTKDVPFGEQLGDLSGLAVDRLLARAPVCGEQDVADQVIDLANRIGGIRP